MIKVSHQLKEDRSHGLETNKGSSLAIRLFKTYANKMFKEPPQGSKDKHTISFVLKASLTCTFKLNRTNK